MPASPAVGDRGSPRAQAHAHCNQVDRDDPAADKDNGMVIRVPLRLESGVHKVEWKAVFGGPSRKSCSLAPTRSRQQIAIAWLQP
jgi:hypothetical protein